MRPGRNVHQEHRYLPACRETRGLRQRKDFPFCLEAAPGCCSCAVLSPQR